MWTIPRLFASAMLVIAGSTQTSSVMFSVWMTANIFFFNTKNNERWESDDDLYSEVWCFMIGIYIPLTFL